MSKHETVPGKKPREPEKPKPAPIPGDLKERLRELDSVDAEFGEDFYEGLHDKIMARIEKTPVSSPEKRPEPVRRKASDRGLSLVQLTL